MDENALRKQVNASGFPFQLRVEHLVNESSDLHNCRVVAREHPWVNRESGRGGYIDLILEKRPRGVPWYVVVECKRTRGGGKWIFLTPGMALQHAEALILLAQRSDRLLHWLEARLFPETFLSSFCTVPGQADKNTPMLERISTELLDSAECFAEAQVSVDFPEVQPGFSLNWDRAVFIPVIITNAELLINQFQPGDVDLAEGEIPDGVGQFVSVPYVRFQKSIDTRFSTTEVPINLQQANHQSQRTVFVVHAPSFPDFLQGLMFNM